MFTVTNRICVKKGFGHKMAPAFIASKSLLNWDGFNKVEVNVCTQPEDHDEMNIMSYWDTLEQFESWRISDDFKAIHSRQASGSGESPVISNRVVISEIAGVLAK
ncbi:antibiotic biosynthesis monooxygenase [Solibacillus sp. MA9]|uniref:Antibiotic biosynthesis monooxygenase n=1 Tax=Solibacillus palustris TaxID=2908203 RepID=A0ABS9UEJ1_9BACL|nr:antibiotic biosynthesis monooxygenase [Solibacillus sp. MA9]MCH7322560.1 antibiotic biosynthesis monooxygenase [Solibacillus sp. MA9]